MVLTSSDGKCAEFYKPRQCWRVKTNIPGPWYDFEVVRFVKPEPKMDWMESDWFEFLIDSTLKFCIIEDPFLRNSRLWDPNDMRLSVC